MPPIWVSFQKISFKNQLPYILMKHGLSIDVEDYYQIIYRDYFHKKKPLSNEVEKNTRWFVKTLNDAGVHATFFVLGNVAETYPDLIKYIADSGHEIGIHGYDHAYINTMTPGRFHYDLQKTKDVIEKIIETPVTGYRAPTFSITKDTLWAFDVLKKSGFIYDSSIFPVKTARYGINSAQKKIYRLENGLWEIPLSCLEWYGKTFPVAGGGYLRHFPYRYTRMCIRCLEKSGRPAIVYMHPYEFEKSYPCIKDMKQPLKLRWHNFTQAHNRGIKQQGKLSALLSDFTFVPLKSLIPFQA